MAEQTTDTTGGTGAASPDEGSTRRIRRQRPLPGGRAVVGALLVSAAAVAVFAAYLDAGADPETSYLTASTSVLPGTMIEDRDMALDLFAAAPIDLVAPVDQRVVPVEELDALVGRVVLVALERGDLLHRGALLDTGGVGDRRAVSFELAHHDALAGELVAGERIDVLATYTGRGEAYTAFVARDVPVLALGGGGTSTVVLTVGVASPTQLQALGHAVNTASVFVARAGARASAEPHPAPYRPTVESLQPPGSLSSEED